MENKYYIYAHINPLKHEIFYIGKGCSYRAYQKTGRNTWWKKTINKYGLIIDILEEGLAEEEAFEREKYYIQKIGRRDLGLGSLVNMTDGGDGMSNPSEETLKAKSSEMKKRYKSGWEHPKGMLGKNHSQEAKDKVSNAKTGKKHSEVTKKIMSDLAKERMKNGFKVPSTLGIKMSDEAKRKNLETYKKKSPPIYSVNIKTNEITDYISIWDAIEKNKDYNKKTLFGALRGYKNSYRGFKWYYK
jgi:hypothetical protein